MGHPRQAPPRSHEQQEEVRIAVPVQEERPSTCQHVHQRLSRCLHRQKSRPCSGWTRRRSPGGQRQESSRRSGRSAATAATGKLRSAHFWRASRSSARNEGRPQVRRMAPVGLVRDEAQAASGHMCSSWGGRPRRPAHRIGGRASRRCDVGHRSADVAGVDPASWLRPGDRRFVAQQVLAHRPSKSGSGVPVPAAPATRRTRSHDLSGRHLTRRFPHGW
jgi:hypothetical protein